MRTAKIVGFSEIFKFAEKKYDIDWNTANDVFFNNVFEYGKMTSATLGLEVLGYIDEEEMKECLEIDGGDFSNLSERFDKAEKITGVLTKQDVLNLPDSIKSYIIMAEFFESINAKGHILIDAQ